MATILSNTMIVSLFLLITSLNSFALSDHRKPGRRKLLWTDADIAQFPYQASLRYNSTKDHFCGGAILNESFILTAAHCMLQLETAQEQIEPNEFFIVAGQTKLELRQNSVTRNVKRIVLHPFFRAYKFRHDLALVELETKLPLTNLIKPIKLTREEIKDNLICTVTGWGKLSNEIKEQKIHRKTSQTLKKDEVLSFTQKSCFERYLELGAYQLKLAIAKISFCTESIYGDAAKPVNVCEAADDSGGPLVCKGRLTGIVSFGTDCTIVSHPATYTDVEEHLWWIERLGNDFKRSSKPRSNTVVTSSASSKCFYRNNYLYFIFIIANANYILITILPYRR